MACCDFLFIEIASYTLIVLQMFDSAFFRAAGVIYTGVDEYAEKPWPSMPSYFAMPFNTLINIIYTFLGVYWLFLRRQKRDHSVNLRVFCWIIIIYSGVQLFRIVTQQHFFGVLDQWYTLHIASWVFLWALSLQLEKDNWIVKNFILIELILCLSYPILGNLHPHGYEVTIGTHLILILVAVIRLHMTLKNEKDTNFRVCLLCICASCCIGFVLFDLLELYLATLWPSMFTVWSGHFFSRVCDILQIHFMITLLTMIEDYKFQEHNEKVKLRRITQKYK
ncbi:unnamed protein product [Adineta steineri]|uniref:Transmembrane protein n=1 Tax=Adineta steineri TaxID=433720 RepID=A0A814ING5_9BILA|nr:unnamed protein product [Adineta steineri]